MNGFLERALVFAEYYGAAEFDDELFASASADWSNERKISALFLLASGRYPKRDEFAEECALLSCFKLKPIEIVESIQKRRACVNTKLTIASGEFVYDVTHTIGYTWLSGIQRVVRDVGRELRNFGSVVYVVHRPNVGLMALSQESVDVFISGEGKSFKTQEQALTFSKKLVIVAEQVLRNLLPRAFYRFAYKAAVWIRARVRFLREWRHSISAPDPRDERESVLWPGHSKLVLAELLDQSRFDEYYSIIDSFDRSVAIFYDMIPISHPYYCAPGINAGHAEYVQLVASCDSIAPISESAAECFRAYCKAIGKSTGEIKAVLLPAEKGFNSDSDNRGSKAVKDGDDVPLIMYVSTIEPRKNHWRLLIACEKLWDAGLRFRLRLVGGGGWRNQALKERILAIEARGYPLEYSREFLSDSDISELYEECIFSVFCSEVEGYGLPIVESLRHGVPVMCSNSGSMREIAETTGGCYQIDPLSIDDIASGIQKLLTDRGVIESLRQEIDLTALGSSYDYVQSVLQIGE